MKSAVDGWKEFDKSVDYTDVRELLYDLMFSLELNANDFFGWACADSVTVSVFDMWWVLPIVKKYKHSGVSAVMSYIEQSQPIEPHRTENFLKAFKELEELDPQVYSRDYREEEDE